MSLAKTACQTSVQAEFWIRELQLSVACAFVWAGKVAVIVVAICVLRLVKFIASFASLRSAAGKSASQSAEC